MRYAQYLKENKRSYQFLIHIVRILFKIKNGHGMDTVNIKPLIKWWSQRCQTRTFMQNIH